MRNAFDSNFYSGNSYGELGCHWPWPIWSLPLKVTWTHPCTAAVEELGCHWPLGPFRPTLKRVSLDSPAAAVEELGCRPWPILDPTLRFNWTHLALQLWMSWLQPHYIQS
ncbi:hypothetical protein AVEN_170707-1 [Araneus ventricosus]|uniref:Uncharacterized protein n=1 Tax=Araneus ventricosus TaxID=182803 RepID=A0A4Y2V1E2_ARAVE|nr:hypothetical protein AVEN_170707-1 [Araneus ventricosus]